MDDDALHNDAQQEASAEPPRNRPLSVGARLTEARAATGRELPDIARETRVPLRHLMAIEADDHGSLPALPYALGFVKSYARCIGLDPEALAAQFRAETSLTPHVPTPPASQPADEARLPSRNLAVGSLVLLAAVILGLSLYGAGVFDPAPPPVVALAPEPEARPLPAPPAAAADGLAAGAATAMPADPALPPAAIAPAAVQPAATTVPAIPTAGPVVLLAREDVWVKIYDAATRRRAFMGVLAAGQRFEVPAGSALVLRAGKAGMIEVSVAGVKLPPLGGPVATIDGVLLTAPALAARFDPTAPPPPAPRLRARRLQPQTAPVQPPVIPAPADGGASSQPASPGA
jgi:cytoskeleton protein RodZ